MSNKGAGPTASVWERNRKWFQEPCMRQRTPGLSNWKGPRSLRRCPLPLLLHPTEQKTGPRESRGLSRKHRVGAGARAGRRPQTPPGNVSAVFLLFLNFIFSSSLHSMLFRVGFRCIAEWLDHHPLYKTIPRCFKYPPVTIRRCYNVTD